jgi:hypothetical protein
MLRRLLSSCRDVDGNNRLTAHTGLWLLLLGLIEAGTLLVGLQATLPVHIFVGLALVPPVLLKLASTGWRFLRYYAGDPDYRAAGPPQLGMRLLAPLLVGLTVAVLATGIGMGVLNGQARQAARQAHGPVAVAWLSVVGVHVLVYLRRAFRHTRGELRPDVTAAAARMRRRLALGSVAAGVLLALALVPVQRDWSHLHHHHRHDDDVRTGAATARGHAATSRLSIRPHARAGEGRAAAS